ncbi:cytochrome C [Flavobacterium sp.]|uniref:cytochrome C n=1 Tax=Flavobacterium sp. TaxID=239 RepID=UPI0026212AC4|nr:cytochrome C [Flavobacterium sp.]MDG2432360.1 cytochrome C [Flavobacterium sp.]
MDSKSKVIIFVDDDTQPIGEFEAPVNFELDTRKLIDGLHQLKIVSKDPTGKEGIKIIPFTVRNGPAIAIEGLNDNDVVDGVLPLMINAYGKGNQKQFLIDGSETPKSVPSWLFAAIIAFIAWAIYFTITSLG